MENDSLRRRLRRIEGQVQGIQRMLDEGRVCDDVLNQLLAVRAAVEQASLLMTEQHIRECVFHDELAADDPRLQAVQAALRMWIRAGA